jgi:hypothetical protein
VPLVDRALTTLDDVTVARVRPALAWLHEQTPGIGRDPDVAALRRFLWRELPATWPVEHHEQHEVAWALGELFETAGLAEQAALCRAPVTHEILSVWRWTRSFRDVPAAFWTAALSRLGPRPGPPAKVGLSLASVRGLLEAVGGGITLTAEGRLPPGTVLALDDRFRWTEEFPWMRPDEEWDIPPLRFLHQHLAAQGLLARDGSRLAVTALGRAGLADVGRLWSAVVEPAPRWTQEFDRDVLGVMAATLLRRGSFTPGRMTEEIAGVLAAKWRPARGDRGSSVFDGAAVVVQEWYQLGVPLGWWDTGRGPADRHPNVFGAAAAGAVFRSATGRGGARRA